ncbi:diglucosylglycerate octanoyltransferase [Gordonia sp. DT219]|uniref:diglucosylglycerate octanoyltransferase n=1 Tax=Gordonia sp. DT219 TaxID=3416658 RepID=UPI003CEC137B
MIDRRHPAHSADGSVLVLSDSLAYYGPGGGLPADDRRIWPNLVGDRVGLSTCLFGRIGWTSRDVWWALTQDPNIWAAVPAARAVVIAIGGMDSLPSPLPTALREQIRYLRPPRLRQSVRTGYQWVQPRAARIGWPMALPPKVTIEHLERIRGALSSLRPELPIVVCLPPTHRSPYYGSVHTGRVPTTAAMLRWATGAGLPTVDFYPITRDLFADPDVEMNPDGIHWGFECHAQIADAVTDVVEPVLRP